MPTRRMIRCNTKTRPKNPDPSRKFVELMVSIPSPGQRIIGYIPFLGHKESCDLKTGGLEIPEPCYRESTPSFLEGPMILRDIYIYTLDAQGSKTHSYLFLPKRVFVVGFFPNVLSVAKSPMMAHSPVLAERRPWQKPSYREWSSHPLLRNLYSLDFSGSSKGW